MRRWAGLSGLWFVVLFALGATLYGAGAGSRQQEITAYYASSRSRLHQIEGFAVLLVASVLLMLYVAVLRRRTVRDALMGDVAILSGAAAVAFLMLANALWATTAFTVQIQGSYEVAAESHLLIEDAAFICLVTGMAAAIPWVLVTSFSGVRNGELPSWFAVLGVIAMVGQALAYWYLPLIGFLLWVAAGSVLLVVRPGSTSNPKPALATPRAAVH